MSGLLSLMPHPLMLAGERICAPAPRSLSITAESNTQVGDPASPATGFT